VDSGLRRRIRATDLPTIPEARRRDLQMLPVSVYPNKEAL